jgi:PII-like signaling protein
VSTATGSRFEATPATRLTLHMSVRDHVRRANLEVEVVKRARRAKLAGVTVFEGEEGFGTSGHLYRGHLLANDRPLAVVVVDRPDRIERFLDEIGDLLGGVLATVDEVEVLEW